MSTPAVWPWFIEWLMKLSPPLAIRYRDEFDAIQKEKGMPYITSIERMAKEEGARKDEPRDAKTV